MIHDFIHVGGLFISNSHFSPYQTFIHWFALYRTGLEHAVNLPFKQVYCFSRYSLRILLPHHETLPGVDNVLDKTRVYTSCTYKWIKRRRFPFQTPTILCKTTYFNCSAVMEGRNKMLHDLEGVNGGNVSAKARSETR